LFLRRSVIQQNIVLLTAKKKWVSFSYTLVTKWYKKFWQSLTQIFSLLKQYIFIILVFYLFSFLFYINYSFYYDFDFFNYKGIFYFLVLNILYFVFSLSRGFLLAFLNFSFLLFSILFYFVNF
jgi:ABC-type multidrug transport system permease subunit